MESSITFKTLQKDHFSLMLKWLGEPHVKKWWDQDIVYTMHLVEKKYGSYLNGHKQENGLQKSIHSFVIYQENHPIGYVQYYNAYNFKREYILEDLPENLAAIDIFIGDKNYIGLGLGALCLQKFVNDIVYKNHRYAFVNPDYKNVAAVRSCERADFKIIKRVQDKFYMVAMKKQFRMSVEGAIALEISFKKNFSPDDHLWIFGSRVNLVKKGGDIDLYIETNKNAKDTTKAHFSFLKTLEEKIGEQKIDVVINLLHSDCFLPIYNVAKKEGFQIV